MKESRVYLRALEPEDYLVSVKWRNDDSVSDMLCGLKRFVSAAYEKKWVEDAIFNSKDVRLAVCLVEDGTYIGNVYMTGIDYLNQSCESHIMIGDKRYWSKGYGAEALKLAIDYMISEHHIHRISALVLETNKASFKMHQKLGYEIEGLLRDSVYKNGKFPNQYVLSYVV